MKYSIIILVLLCVVGCINSKNNSRSVNFQDYKYLDSTDYASTYCEFISNSDSFEMKIIFRVSNCNCGFAHHLCATNTVGVKSNGDTIRVLSLCDTAHFHYVNKITAYPKALKVPLESVYINREWVYNTKTKTASLSNFCGRKYKTFWGIVRPVYEH